MGPVVISEGLGGGMVSTLAQVARDLCSNHALGSVFPTFITHTTLVAMTMILYKLCTVWLLNLPCVCVCEVTDGMDVFVSIERLAIPRG